MQNTCSKTWCNKYWKIIKLETQQGAKNHKEKTIKTRFKKIMNFGRGPRGVTQEVTTKRFCSSKLLTANFRTWPWKVLRLSAGVPRTRVRKGTGFYAKLIKHGTKKTPKSTKMEPKRRPNEPRNLSKHHLGNGIEKVRKKEVAMHHLLDTLSIKSL